MKMRNVGLIDNCNRAASPLKCFAFGNNILYFDYKLIYFANIDRLETSRFKYLFMDRPHSKFFFIRDFVVVKDLAIEDEHFQKKLELLTGENKKKNTHLVNF